MADIGIEKRRSPRAAAAKGAEGRLKGSIKVDIVNVSPDGLLFEVATALRPGAVYDLKAELEGVTFAAQIRVTRCRAGSYVDDSRGGRMLLYRAGSEFVQLDHGSHERLTHWVTMNLRKKTPSSAAIHPHS